MGCTLPLSQFHVLMPRLRRDPKNKVLRVILIALDWPRLRARRAIGAKHHTDCPLNRSSNFKFSHVELKGRSIQTQTGRCTVWPRQNPLGRFQSRQNVGTFNFLQRRVTRVAIVGYGSVTKILTTNSQIWTRGEAPRP